MKLAITELEAKLAQAAERFVGTTEAAYFAHEVTEAHIRKAPRSNPLKEAVDDLEACAKYDGKGLRYQTDLPSFVSADFGGQGPLVYLKQLHDELAGRAAKNGLAMMALTNSRSMHTLHTWVQGLAKRGLVAVAVCNGGPNAVVPFNGTKGVLGTNPMAYAIPGQNGEIHCVDMATSEIPYFEILDAYHGGKPLREGVAVDAQGEYTTDASKALDFSASKTDPVSNIVPMGGGYKGFYLVYLLEVLTSGLIGTPSSAEQHQDFVAEEHGAILMAFNPKVMGTENALVKTVTQLHEAIKGQPAKRDEEMRLPGEANNLKYAQGRDQPVEVDEGLIVKLDELA